MTSTARRPGLTSAPLDRLATAVERAQAATAGHWTRYAREVAL